MSVGYFSHVHNVWRVLVRALQIGSVACLCFLAIAIQLPAGAQLELPSPTTLPPTTLPAISLTSTTLIETTVSSLAETTESSLAESTTGLISTVESTTSGTLADLDDSDSLMEDDDFCTVGSSLLESELLDCEPQMSTSTGDPAGFGGLPSGVVPLFGDDEGSGDPSGEQEGDEEKEAESSPEPAPDPGDEESPPTLIDRLLDWIDQILKPFDVEVAGIQLLSATGIAVMLIAAVAIGLLLTGLGVVKLPDWFPGSTNSK